MEKALAKSSLDSPFLVLIRLSLRNRFVTVVGFAKFTTFHANIKTETAASNHFQIGSRIALSEPGSGPAYHARFTLFRFRTLFNCIRHLLEVSFAFVILTRSFIQYRGGLEERISIH